MIELTFFFLNSVIGIYQPGYLRVLIKKMCHLTGFKHAPHFIEETTFESGVLYNI